MRASMISLRTCNTTISMKTCSTPATGGHLLQSCPMFGHGHVLSVVAEHAFSLYDDQGVIEGHLGELHVSGGEAAFLNHVMDAL